MGVCSGVSVVEREAAVCGYYVNVLGQRRRHGCNGQARWVRCVHKEGATRRDGRCSSAVAVTVAVAVAVAVASERY